MGEQGLSRFCRNVNLSCFCGNVNLSRYSGTQSNNLVSSR